MGQQKNPCMRLTNYWIGRRKTVFFCQFFPIQGEQKELLLNTYIVLGRFPVFFGELCMMRTEQVVLELPISRLRSGKWTRRRISIIMFTAHWRENKMAHKNNDSPEATVSKRASHGNFFANEASDRTNFLAFLLVNVRILAFIPHLPGRLVTWRRCHLHKLGDRENRNKRIKEWIMMWKGKQQKM
jgi:hypothetical protein